MDARTRLRGVAASLLLLGLSPALATAAPAPVAHLKLRACTQKRDDATRCGRVSVPLDRSGALRGRVSLKVRVVSASRRPKETVLALAGGPGQAAAPLLEPIADALGPIAATRRIVTFDQRGTGGSGRLRCPQLARATDRTIDRAVAACARRLGPRRAAYTTAASVEDIEAVRAALGVARLTLYGVSYGTKVALDYAARYPQHVSRLLLDSLLLPGGSDPFMRTTIASVPRVLRTLCAPRACRFTRDPSADLTALVARIARRGPLQGIRYDGRGRPQRVAITREALLALLLGGDFDPFGRALVPGAVRAALDGDTALLARMLGGDAVAGLDSDSGDSDALFVATSCEDGGVPWAIGTPLDQRAAALETELRGIPADSLAPFDRATVRRSGIGYCRRWPEAPIAQPAAPLPDVPTLILSGDDDLRTPRKDALTLAARMPSATLVTVPESGHSVLSSDITSCSRRALVRFFAGKRARDCKYHPPREFAPQQPPPLRVSQLAPFHGLRPPAGRTLTAVNLSFEQLLTDLFSSYFVALLSGESPERLVAAVGGLRGGWARLSADGLTVRGYSHVPGVRLSLRIGADADDDAPLVLRVSGGPAVRGTLSFSEQGISGTLGGQRVAVSAEDADADARTRQGRAAAAERGGEPAAAALRSRISVAAVRETLAAARRRTSSGLGAPPLPVVPPSPLNR